MKPFLWFLSDMAFRMIAGMGPNTISPSGVGYLLLLPLLLSVTISLHTEEDPHDRNRKLQVLIPESAQEGPWSEDPTEFKDLDILGDFGEDSSKQSLEKTREHLSKALDDFRKTSESVQTRRKAEEAKVLESERYEWQKKTRIENAERAFSREIAQARLESVKQLALAMRNMDKIKNPRINRSESFLDLKAGVYREFIKHQYALRNYVQSAEFLEKYIALDPKMNDEAEPHRMLSHCYERLYLSAKKSGDANAMDYYQSRRKKHGILYAEIAYGRESYEFKKVLELLARD
nr:hypothetical protein [Leptospira wolffii]